jgi:hypothetical protein
MDYDIGAFASQADRNGATNALGGAGYQRDASL